MLAGDSVEVQCDATYVLSSTSSATANCETSGEYDHDVAVCVAVCPAHPPVKHGKLSVTGTTAEGDEVQVTCDDGYALEYPEMAAVACTATHEYSQPWLQTKGTHTGAYSRCVAVCPPYPNVDFGTVTVEECAPRDEGVCLENGKIDDDCCGFPKTTACADGFTMSAAATPVCYEDKSKNIRLFRPQILKSPLLVNLYSTYTRVLTFENVCQHVLRFVTRQFVERRRRPRARGVSCAGHVRQRLQ